MNPFKTVYVNCLFIFAPDGRIRTTVYNAPGTFHDSAMADNGVYATIESLQMEELEQQFIMQLVHSMILQWRVMVSMQRWNQYTKGLWVRLYWTQHSD